MTKHGVNLHPFKGIRYNLHQELSISSPAPPYDLFEYGDGLDNLLRSYAQNIVHIQKPEGKDDQKYINAQKILSEWLDKKILQEDDKEYFYIYEQETEFGVRRGVIASADIDDSYAKIRRHEKTKQGPKIDRYKLTVATGLNIGLIFTILNDPGQKVSTRLAELVSQNTPLQDFIWPDCYVNSSVEELQSYGKVRNRVYRVQDETLAELLKDKILYIADGHHRYQTMIDYRNRMREIYKKENIDPEQWHFERTMLFAAPDTDLVVLGYPRVVKDISIERYSRFMERVHEDFHELESKEGYVYKPLRKGQIGMYYQGKGYLLEKRLTSEDESLLDTEILQRYILERVLGIDEDMAKSGKYISYPNGEEDLQKIRPLVDGGSHQVAFTLYPTSVEELKHVADQGQVLPQKSTYFYPKLLTGLVLNRVARPQNDLSV